MIRCWSHHTHKNGRKKKLKLKLGAHLGGYTTCKPFPGIVFLLHFVSVCQNYVIHVLNRYACQGSPQCQLTCLIRLLS